MSYYYMINHTILKLSVASPASAAAAAAAAEAVALVARHGPLYMCVYIYIYTYPTSD